ncbi:MAG: acetylglutamate kinase [Alcanivoracaceae bacterium]|nr:acetylglutamate kinase [Alcanivoracaceae bacterium]
MNTIQNLIREVLLQLGNSTEAQYYLDHYQKARQVKFAVVKVGGNVINAQLQQLVQSLSLLTHLGLTPIVLHGAGPQIDAEIAKQQLPVNKLDGLRVTDDKTIEIIQPVIQKVHQQLLDALAEVDINTKSIFNSVFSCDYLDKEKYGFVGSIKQVNLELINQAIKNKQVPVISCLGMTDNGQVVNINADTAIRQLVWESKPAKVIFVTPTGGLLDQNDQLISAVQLSLQYDDLMQQPWLHSGMKLKIQQIYQLLKPMPRKLSVSITSATQLAKELFTHKGKGTFLSMGEHINHHNTLGTAVKLQLSSLLESTFGKKLKPDFYETLDFKSLLISESGQAAALISTGHNGKAYLSKFAVTPVAQGQGLGKAIWQQMLNAYPQIYWRSRADNQINSWYYKQADCSHKKGSWIVFSCGMNLQDSMSCMDKGAHYEDSWLERKYA